MVKCTFCGLELEPGSGIQYITKEGKILYFTGSKCEKNFLKLGRKPLHTKWSERWQSNKA